MCKLGVDFTEIGEQNTLLEISCITSSVEEPIA